MNEPKLGELPMSQGPGSTFKDSQGNTYRIEQDGSRRKLTGNNDTPKKMSWRDRADRAEKMVIALVDERSKLRDLLLESVQQINKHDWSDGEMKLKEFHPYVEIASFARGRPDIEPIPLENLDRAGVRHAKKMTRGMQEAEGGLASWDVWMECGHVASLTNVKDAEQIKPGCEIVCPRCVELLKERGLYEPREDNRAFGSGHIGESE